MSDTSHTILIRDLLIQEIKRRLFEESIPRAKKCLSLLTEEEVWFRPNENSNSVGNLILHLCGNVRQWLISAMGNQPDIRKRQVEFDKKGPIPTQQLFKNLDELQIDAGKVLDDLSPESLTRIYQVQGYKENGLAILIHIVEHFSYHIGQITYVVKARKNMQTNYYADHNLDEKNA